MFAANPFKDPSAAWMTCSDNCIFNHNAVNKYVPKVMK